MSALWEMMSVSLVVGVLIGAGVLYMMFAAFLRIRRPRPDDPAPLDPRP